VFRRPSAVPRLLLKPLCQPARGLRAPGWCRWSVSVGRARRGLPWASDRPRQDPGRRGSGPLQLVHTHGSGSHRSSFLSATARGISGGSSRVASVRLVAGAARFLGAPVRHADDGRQWKMRPGPGDGPSWPRPHTIEERGSSALRRRASAPVHLSGGIVSGEDVGQRVSWRRQRGAPAGKPHTRAALGIRSADPWPVLPQSRRRVVHTTGR
jgi:hypothetical protein